MVKLAMWMNMPSHHQAGFFEALRQAGVDLRVNYYGKVSRRRRERGWAEVATLPTGERFVAADIRELYAMRDWRDRIHVVPGYGCRFLRQLAAALSHQHVPWMHWSERAQQGARWLLSYPLKAWYARRVNRGAVAALAIGELAGRDFVRWGVDAAKIRVLPYSGMLPPKAAAIDESIARFARGAAPLFMYIGALYRGKGVDLLIRAFARIAGTCPRARLALVGKDESRGRYGRLIERYGLRDRILVRGPLPFEHVGAALQAADVLVLASRHDGWGMVLAEAAGYGKALIASDACGAAAHLIEEGWNGFTVPAGATAALAQAMQRYAGIPDLAVLHGRRSLRRYGDFTPERNAERLLAILGERTRTMTQPAREPDGSVPVRQ